MSNKPLTPGCKAVIDGKTYTFVEQEKRGRWDYAIAKDTKGKKHEFLLGKFQQALNDTPDPEPETKATEPVKENPVAKTTDTPEKAPKPEKAPAEPKAPRVRKDISGDPMAMGFQKFRDQHPAYSLEGAKRKFQDKGDEVAQILASELLANGDDIFACPTVIKHLNVEELRAKYANLNKGMQRMNIGNRLRGILAPNPDKQKREIEKAEAKAKREAERLAKVAEKEAEKAKKTAEREAKAAEAKAAKEAKATAKAE